MTQKLATMYGSGRRWGRTEHGRLIEVEPYYTHSYGKFVPEIIEIDKKLREEMGGIA